MTLVTFFNFEESLTLDDQTRLDLPGLPIAWMPTYSSEGFLTSCKDSCMAICRKEVEGGSEGMKGDS